MQLQSGQLEQSKQDRAFLKGHIPMTVVIVRFEITNVWSVVQHHHHQPQLHGILNLTDRFMLNKFRSTCTVSSQEREGGKNIRQK